MSEVHRDERRGHFVLALSPTSHHKREVVACDLGSSLHLTTYGAHLSPDEARTLAGALVWWADRKHEATDDLERVVEMNDLLDLIEAQA